MTKSVSLQGFQSNRNCSDSAPPAVPIHHQESEQFKTRLSEVIGDRKLVWFAKECRFSDSLLGAYVRGEKLPELENLVAIADAGGVTLDWLAAGRPPKTRAEQRALAAAARPAPGEAELLAVWRSAGPAGRHALAQLAAALRSPSAPAWLAAGQAIAEAARLADPHPAKD